MSAELLVKVQHGSFLEETMSRRQLHEAERGVEGGRRRRPTAKIRDVAVEEPSARSCGMEALGVTQHRTKVKLRKASEVWGQHAAQCDARYPDVTSRYWRRCGVKLCVLTQGDLYVSAQYGRAGEGNDDRPMRVEKSDHLVVVSKPGNAGGAKGVTG